MNQEIKNLLENISNNKNLTELDLSYKNYSSNDIFQIFNQLKLNNSITNINLTSN